MIALPSSLLQWTRSRRTQLDSSSFFTLLWMLAIVAHFDSRLDWHRDWSFVFAPVSAGIAAFFTRSPLLVGTALVAQQISLWEKMPTPDNHWFFAGVVSALMLFALLRSLIVDRSWRGGLPEGWMGPVEGALRLSVVLLYFFATFHKLNLDFLDPSISCGPHFYRRVARAPYIVGLPESLSSDTWRSAVIYGTLMVEGGIALLLAWRRSWWAGILLGFSFHMLTGAIMRHFPMIMSATYFLFIPRELREALVAKIDARLRGWSRNKVGLRTLIYLQAIFWSSWSFLIWSRMQAAGARSSGKYGYWELLRVWDLMMIFTALWVIVELWRLRKTPRAPVGHLSGASPLSYLLPLWLFFNGMSPYLGLKTSTAIAMWSNLVVSDHHSNHLIIPQGSLKVFPYLDDVIELKSTNQKHWQRRYVYQDRRMPFVMLQRKLRWRYYQKKQADLRFVRDGVEYNYEGAEQEPELRDAGARWFRKYVHVKDTPGEDKRGRCTW